MYKSWHKHEFERNFQIIKEISNCCFKFFARFRKRGLNKNRADTWVRLYATKDNCLRNDWKVLIHRL